MFLLTKWICSRALTSYKLSFSLLENNTALSGTFTAPNVKLKTQTNDVYVEMS